MRWQRAEKFSLPLAEMASEALKLAGWKVVGPDEAADLTLTVKASGQALGAEYTGTIPGFHYSGAELSGSVQLEQGDRIITAEPFAGKVPVDSIIHRSYWKPESAPFFQTLPHFCTALFTVIGRAVGPAPLVAGMKLDNFEQQAGAGRALMTEGNASVTPALIELLEPGDRLAARPAALGLGVFGDAAALPPLLAALRKDTSNVSSVKYNDEFDNELLNSLTGDFDEPLPPAERATAAGRGLDEFWTLHRAVEWALVQIVAPGKIELLTAALLSPDSVMLRRGAAVVFGCLKDPRAFGPLAAAARDKEPIVRAAAVAALGRLPDERKVDLLLAASADATDYVSKLARDQLAEIAQERWRKFLQARTPQNARWDQIPVSLLRAGFADADPLVRASAARLTIYRTEPELLAGLRHYCKRTGRLWSARR